ncbi:MAG: gamma carbonic anhydrase family protein [Gammaproteobacteria bacterium]|nr:gamma carbonic anhydrase family protein [Gammaproteobacteria bacterium]TDJ44390.1 MAG: gamma carbonic anhydrase family protein [Gammaproteobacteria bacterium]
MIYDLGEDRVQTIGDDYFVAPNSAVIGRVSLGQDASVWFNVVLRGDNDSITIGDRSNIQDGSVFHVDAGAPVVLGSDVSVGHSATVHGCTVGSGSLVGMGATILSHAVIGERCIVGAQALITESKEFPDRSVIIGAPARRIREVTDEELEHIQWIAEHYVARAQRYRAELKAR